MRIEVDTKQDSKEEIKHIIKLLMAAVNAKDSEIFTNDSSNSLSQQSDNPLVNMFKENQAQDNMQSKDNEGYVNLFGPVEAPKEEAKPEPALNPMLSIFDSSSNSTPVSNASSQSAQNNEEQKGFYKEFEDESDKKKPRISFYY